MGADPRPAHAPREVLTMDMFTAAASRETTLVPTLPSWVDRELYPFRTAEFRTEDGALSYVDEGTGAPVLFVHGTPSWSFEWRHAIAALSSRARCIAPDHLGFGLSDKPFTAPYRPEDHARRLVALVRHLDLRDITLVVHDFGGPIGLGLLAEVPDRIARVMVVNTWAWPHGTDPRIRRLSGFVRSWLGRLLYRRFNASPRWLVPASFADRRRLTPAIHRQYLAPFSDAASRTAPWVLGCELAGSDAWYAHVWAQRERIDERPLSIVWGADDPAFGADYLARWTETFPHASVTTLPGVGHFPQEEAPEALSAAIERLLDV
jgi:pimeloyl-ACP methyl ester carboxylesterase